MGPEKHDVVLKVMLFPGIQFRNAWKLFHCHVRRSDLHCRQPFVTWASALQSTAPLLAPQVTCDGGALLLLVLVG